MRSGLWRIHLLSANFSPPRSPAPSIVPGSDVVDLLEIEGFLDAAMLAELVAELDAAAGSAATVLSPEAGGTVQAAVRKTTRVAVSPETRERVRQQLMRRKAEIEEHFGVTLAECEDPQFLRYQEGDFFVPHQDGNTPMVWDDSRFRRISAVIFLSEKSEEPAEGTYGGGSLTFHGAYPNYGERVAASAAPGSLVTFRAETTHEVTPVTHGVRYTVATWFR
jgi:SM-20-related protein